jgi:hypothetical protein
MKIKKKQFVAVSLWMTYSDGSLRARFFNEQKPLEAWWKTALRLKELGVVELCSLFPIAYIPTNCQWTTI